MGEKMIETSFERGTDNAADEAANMMMAQAVSGLLLRHYPDHMWLVNADIRNGIINIFNPRVSTRYGYTVVVDDWLQERVVGNKVMLAGGEILERAGLRRGRFNPEEYAALPRNYMGEIILREVAA